MINPNEKRIKSNRGETLVESLVSLLVVSLTIAFLSVAVSTAAKLNTKLRNIDVSFRYTSEPGKTARVTVNGTNISEASKQITIYESNGYLYYDGGSDS